MTAGAVLFAIIARLYKPVAFIAATQQRPLRKGFPSTAERTERAEVGGCDHTRPPWRSELPDRSDWHHPNPKTRFLESTFRLGVLCVLCG